MSSTRPTVPGEWCITECRVPEKELGTDPLQLAHSGMKTRPPRVKTKEFLPILGVARDHLRAHPRYVHPPRKVSLAGKPRCHKAGSAA